MPPPFEDDAVLCPTSHKRVHTPNPFARRGHVSAVRITARRFSATSGVRFSPPELRGGTDVRSTARSEAGGGFVKRRFLGRVKATAENSEQGTRDVVGRRGGQARREKPILRRNRPNLRLDLP